MNIYLKVINNEVRAFADLNALKAVSDSEEYDKVINADEWTGFARFENGEIILGIEFSKLKSETIERFNIYKGNHINNDVVDFNNKTFPIDDGIQARIRSALASNQPVMLWAKEDTQLTEYSDNDARDILALIVSANNSIISRYLNFVTFINNLEDTPIGRDILQNLTWESEI